MSRRQFATWLIIAIVLTVATIWAFWPRPVPVDMTNVSRGPMLETLSEEGKAQIHDVYVVAAPAAGHMTRIDLEPGDCAVKEETEIAIVFAAAVPELDARSKAEAEAALRAARATLRGADAEIEQQAAAFANAQADFNRIQTLANSGTASMQALDRREADMKASAAALRGAEASKERAQQDVSRWQATLMPGHLAGAEGGLLIETPVSGLVLRVLRDSEGPVAIGEPLIEIGRPLEIEIAADFLSEDAVQIREGHRVILRDWGGASIDGRVRRVEPYAFTKVSALGIEEQRTNVMIDLDHVPEALGHGYRVRVDVVIWESDDVLRVPLTALFRSGETWVTYKKSAGRAKLTAIGVGHMNGTFAEVLSGLSEGEQVIEHPSNRIGDGVRIQARPSGNTQIELEQADPSPATLTSSSDASGLCAED